MDLRVCIETVVCGVSDTESYTYIFWGFNGVGGMLTQDNIDISIQYYSPQHDNTG